MTDELLSLRLAVVSDAVRDHDLFRHAVTSATIPIEVVATDGAAAAQKGLAAGADLLYLSGRLAASAIKRTVAAARAAGNPPFTVLLSDGDDGLAQFEVDAVTGSPTRLDDAKRLVERSIRVRLPSRVLVVDDSATVRAIVCKLLAGARFPLEVSEADGGVAALQMVRESAIDLVFVDDNMPGFSGLETIAQLRREKPSVHVVLMTAMNDESLPERARRHGAGFLKKPFYLADVDAVLCPYYGLRALNPKRA